MKKLAFALIAFFFVTNLSAQIEVKSTDREACCFKR